MVVDSIRQMTVEEYFAFDEASEYKNEYVDGEVYPMTGGTVNHDTLIVNTIVALWQRVSRSGCQVHAGHVRHSVSPTRYLYPDVSVVCGAPETDERSLNLFNPVLVTEVTSPSTSDYDRGNKRRHYQTIPSLQAYLVIDQDEARMEVDSRAASGWQTHSYTGLDAVIPLPALACELPLAEIYHGVEV